MEVRHHENLPCLQFLLVSDDVGEPIEKTGLKWGTALDLVIRIVKLQDVRVVIEELVFWDVGALLSLELVESYLNYFISIVDVALNVIIKIGLQSSDELATFDHKAIYDLLGINIVKRNKFISFVGVVLDTGENN